MTAKLSPRAASPSVPAFTSPSADAIKAQIAKKITGINTTIQNRLEFLNANEQQLKQTLVPFMNKVLQLSLQVQTQLSTIGNLSTKLSEIQTQKPNGNPASIKASAISTEQPINMAMSNISKQMIPLQSEYATIMQQQQQFTADLAKIAQERAILSTILFQNQVIR